MGAAIFVPRVSFRYRDSVKLESVANVNQDGDLEQAQNRNVVTRFLFVIVQCDRS